LSSRIKSHGYRMFSFIDSFPPYCITHQNIHPTIPSKCDFYIWSGPNPFTLRSANFQIKLALYCTSITNNWISYNINATENKLQLCHIWSNKYVKKICMYVLQYTLMGVLLPICLQICIVQQTKSHYNRTYNITSCMLAPFWPSNILNWQKPCKPVNLIHNMNIILNQKLVKVGWNKNALNAGLFIFQQSHKVNALFYYRGCWWKLLVTWCWSIVLDSALSFILHFDNK
jgi:hypothetical protein